jgi:nitrate/nitrite transport system substrate-binding protein
MTAPTDRTPSLLLPARPVSRRGLLKSGAATLGAAALLRAALPGGAWAAAGGPETTKAVLGFIALTDAAPLIVALEKGLFAKHGMPDVQVQKQASWGTTRDNLELGSAGGGIDGAHILTPMPYLMTAGKITKNGQKVPMGILARLNTDGQAVSVATAFKDLKVGTDSAPLKAVFADARKAGKDVKCAVTFPGGTHDLWMRYWLAAGGIDPDKDVSTIVVPPPQMVANMKTGTMETFCVGEPWNAQLVTQGLGYTAFTTGEMWSGHPEKSLALRADWIERHPKAAQALTAAVLEAQVWCDKPENKAEMCAIVAKREWLKIDAADILGRAAGTFDYGTGKVVKDSPHLMKFWRGFASYPFRSHDLWFLTEDVRWGYLPGGTDLKALVAEVNREDVWRAAAKDLGVPADQIPASTSRGKETFFDGKVFDPENPEAYLASLPIARV